MKKKSVFGIILGVLVLIVCSPLFGTPVPVFRNGEQKSGFERVERQPVSVSLKNKAMKTVEDELGIMRSIQGPGLDEDGDGFCKSYFMNTTYHVPEGGATFYSVYYFRIKGQEGEWGEWKKTFTGETYSWTKEDGDNYFTHLLNTIIDELDGVIPRSRGDFKQELYNANDDTLADVFETSSNGRKYWSKPLVESRNNDPLEDPLE